MISSLPKSLIEAAKKVLNESNTHIDVNGQLKHKYNSEGNLIHPTEDGIKNFHRWFGDSDSLDDHGRPLVVYHGTPALQRGQTEETPLPFNEFSKSGSGLISFSKSHDFAEQYAQTKSQDTESDLAPFVFKTYIKTKTFDPSNPSHIDAIRPYLNDKVKHQGKYGWSSFGGEKEYDKEDFLEKLQGIGDVYRPLTKEMHEKAEVGKTMTLDGGQIYIHHKTPTKLYYSPSYQMEVLPEHIQQLRNIAKTEPESAVKHEFMYKHPHSNQWEPPKWKSVNIYNTTFVPAKEKGDNWEYTENDEFKEAAKKAGFNAVKQTERKHENIAVFDKSQIKSTTHNTGEFHPDKMLNEVVLMTNLEKRNKFGNEIIFKAKFKPEMFKEHGLEKISSLDKDHDIYHAPGEFMVYNNKQQKADKVLEVNHFGKDGKSLGIIKLTGRNNSTTKAEDFYHHLITKHGYTLSTTIQSPGGKGVWERLAKKKGIAVHGWDDKANKPVNVNFGDDDTHIEYQEKYNKDDAPIARMMLVAHKKED